MFFFLLFLSVVDDLFCRTVGHLMLKYCLYLYSLLIQCASKLVRLIRYWVTLHVAVVCQIAAYVIKPLKEFHQGLNAILCSKCTCRKWEPWSMAGSLEVTGMLAFTQPNIRGRESMFSFISLNFYFFWIVYEKIAILSCICMHFLLVNH